MFPDRTVGDFIDCRWPHNPLPCFIQSLQNIPDSLKNKLGFKNTNFSGIQVVIQSDLKFIAGTDDFDEFPEYNAIYGYDKNENYKYNGKTPAKHQFCLEKGSSRQKISVALCLHSLSTLGTKFLLGNFEEIHMAVFNGVERLTPRLMLDFVSLKMDSINKKGLGATMTDLYNEKCDLIEDNKDLLISDTDIDNKVIDFPSFLSTLDEYKKRESDYLLQACSGALNPITKKYKALSSIYIYIPYLHTG